MTIIAFIGVLVMLILAHELGHFITAKASGVRVDEFGLGLPPRLLSIKRGETRYSLNAIPMGGFVKIAGEEDPKVPRSLASKSIGTRALVLSAGSLTNFLLPLILFSVALMVPHNQITGQVTVAEIAPDSPAVRAGIRVGDTILSVNNKPVNNSGDLNRYIQLNLGRKITILVRHNDSTQQSLEVIPRWKPPQNQGAMGVVISTSNQTITSQHYPFWQA
ncbi:MAG: site-2 protease family protein, partial [Dehalococcoidales bacterium]|nr:site-2 protease family protein [Dehalococcoidales bacterium]